MYDLHHWCKPADQFAISLPIVFKRKGLLLKQFENSVGGVASSESVCDGILGQVYTNLLDIDIKCIDDELEVSRGRGCHIFRYR